MDIPTVTKNAEHSRFELADNGELAMLNYRERKRHIILIHTEVPASLGGRGYAGALAKTALEYARANGLYVIVHCPFVRTYLERHPEYADLTERQP
jgi:predicted GNAT family acetyltransferase